MANDLRVIRSLQGLGIVSASFASGVIFCLSNVAIPATFQAPPGLAAKQWSDIFWRGLKTGPPGAIIAGLANAYLAYALPSSRRIYSLAAFFPLAIFPYTHFIMVPTNNALMKRDEAASQLADGEEPTEVGMPKGQSTKDLVETWRSYNYIRSVMPIAGALVGAWAVLW